MIENAVFQNAVNRLRLILVSVRAGTAYAPFHPSIDNRDLVYAQYQPIFSSQNISRLTTGEILSFLDADNNQHWTSLQRLGPKITADMDALRQGLTNLLDEPEPIAARYDNAVNGIYGVGPAITTAILHVAYPDKYGVRNGASKKGLQKLQLWPTRTRGETEGKRYVKVNELLLTLAAALDVDLWTLDALWTYMYHEEGTTQ